MLALVWPTQQATSQVRTAFWARTCSPCSRHSPPFRMAHLSPLVCSIQGRRIQSSYHRHGGLEQTLWRGGPSSAPPRHSPITLRANFRHLGPASLSSCSHRWVSTPRVRRLTHSFCARPTHFAPFGL